MSDNLGNALAVRFGQAGACEALVTVLQKYQNQVNVVIKASIAVNSLSRVKGNCTWFGPAGACEALAVVLRIHYSDIAACKFIVMAVGSLCLVENNKDRFGNLGCCSVIAQAMTTHVADVETVKACGMTIGKLCELVSTKSVYAKITAEETAVTAHNYSDDDALSTAERERAIDMQVATVVTAVSEQTLQVITDGLVEQSTSAVVASPVDRQDQSTEKEARASSPAPVVRAGAVSPLSGSKMANASAATPNSHVAFFENNICDILASALALHGADMFAAQVLCRTVAVLTSDSSTTKSVTVEFLLNTAQYSMKTSLTGVVSEMRVRLGNLGACKSVAHALQYHENVEKVAKASCLAIKSLSKNNRRNQNMFRDTGILPALVVVLRGYRYSRSGTGTMEAAAAAILHLTNGDNFKNKNILGKCGVCEGLLEALELHYRNGGIEVSMLLTGLLQLMYHV